MTNFRRHLLALIGIPLLLALTACGPGTPTPGSSGGVSTSPSPGATPGPSGGGDPTAEPDPAREVAVSVNSSLIAVYPVGGGEQVAAVNLAETDHAAAAARLAAALGEEPVITTTLGTGSACDTDQTTYDFGGFFLRSPGLVGSVGAIEVGVVGVATTGGVPIFTLGGAQIGTSRAAFETVAGPVVEIGTWGMSTLVGFDRINPEEPEFDGIGSIAWFDSGVLVDIHAPYYFYGDC